MSLLTAIRNLNDDDNLHLGRLLVLLGGFSSAESGSGIDGLTKLAKLDFLLRYPAYLERALQSQGANGESVHATEAERVSVESTMIRYRYGPWDERHRRHVNLLVSRGLVTVTPHGKSTTIQLTSNGIKLSQELTQSEAFRDMALRVRLLKAHFDKSGTSLKRFIYQTFPEIGTLRWGQEIRA